MKKLLALNLFIGFLFFGCFKVTDSQKFGVLESQAEKDFNCRSIKYTPLQNDKFEASGCNKTIYYVVHCYSSKHVKSCYAHPLAKVID